LPKPATHSAHHRPSISLALLCLFCILVFTLLANPTSQLVLPAGGGAAVLTATLLLGLVGDVDSGAFETAASAALRVPLSAVTLTSVTPASFPRRLLGGSGSSLATFRLSADSSDALRLLNSRSGLLGLQTSLGAALPSLSSLSLVSTTVAAPAAQPGKQPETAAGNATAKAASEATREAPETPLLRSAAQGGGNATASAPAKTRPIPRPQNATLAASKLAGSQARATTAQGAVEPLRAEAQNATQPQTEAAMPKESAQPRRAQRGRETQPQPHSPPLLMLAPAPYQ